MAVLAAAASPALLGPQGEAQRCRAAQQRGAALTVTVPSVPLG